MELDIFLREDFLPLALMEHYITVWYLGACREYENTDHNKSN